ncbi:sphingomyelin synthase family protein [Patescibacteria group bacterium]|nr:sphingomyelin synthase family protein [Patescibacteria group bacterium]MBU1727890.1 sphingomyelin synthase family protein [Patescibacteria group bacterium]
MKKLVKNYKDYTSNKKLILSSIISFAFLFSSLVINFRAGIYATEKASSPVTDIILSNIPVFNVAGIFTYGALVFWIFIALLCLYSPKKIPFTLKSIALFIIIRAVFISLTHIGPFPTQAIIESESLISKFTFGGDLFFSGHTGLPFLMALVFWNEKKLRYFLIVSSFVFGAVVLMTHLHYSIDVLSAFFITYTIFHIATFLFKKDQEMFLN